MKFLKPSLLASFVVFVACISQYPLQAKDPVDFVNPYMGNISHLLVPTFPTIHLPNSLLRVYPERDDFTGDLLKGLPLMITSHRGSSAFNLSPYQDEENGIAPIVLYSYDREKLKPYYYEVSLDDQQTNIKFAPSNQSAIYEIEFTKSNSPVYLILNSGNGMMKAENNHVSGYQQLENNTKVFIYLETEASPLKNGILKENVIDWNNQSTQGTNACIVLHYGDQAQTLRLRYGISFISEVQAKDNLKRELNDFDFAQLAEKGRKIWNDALGKIEVVGDNESDMTVFYTSLYRCFERPVCISVIFGQTDHPVPI